MFQDPWPDKPARIKTVALFLVPVLLVGGIGYRYLMTASAVTSAEALDVFRTAKGLPTGTDPSASDAPERPAAPRTNLNDGSSSRRGPRTKRSAGRTSAPVAASRSERSPARTSTDRSEPVREAPEQRRGWEPGTPEEGVYTWRTEGYESFNGARREFPSETHRIITYEKRRDTWMNHHVFSRERESWTRVATNDEGYFTLYARNRIVFGPVTRDAEFSFDPPMLNNPVGEPSGTTWDGRWDGKTYGTYAGRLLGEDTMRIDGEMVQVTVLQIDMRMQGEVEGTSSMRFWVSNRHHMVIREHYKQDVRTGAAEYHAEWDMTLQSLSPQR